MTTQKNGNTATAPKENGKPVTILTVVPLKKEEQNQSSPVTKVIALDERINRINQLTDLQKQYNRLLASKQKLAEFKMKKGEENIELTIEDDNTRIHFSTKNQPVVKDVLEFVSTKIEERRKELEPLLVW